MDVMIDLELMGNDSDGAVVSIGACPFWRDRNMPSWADVQQYGFQVQVSLQSAINAGGTVTGKSVAFWLKQSDKARLKLLDDPKPLKDALSMTRAYLMSCVDGNHKDLVVWSKPASGDLVILANAFKSVGKPEPWLGKNKRCLSTLKQEIAGIDWISREARLIDPDLVHVALFDCWLQILDTKQALDHMGLLADTQPA